MLPTPPYGVEASYQLAFLLASCAKNANSTPGTSNDSRDPQVTLWMTVRKRKWEPARTAPVFYGSGHMPFPVGTGLRPVQKVAKGSNNRRLSCTGSLSRLYGDFDGGSALHVTPAPPRPFWAETACRIQSDCPAGKLQESRRTAEDQELVG